VTRRTSRRPPLLVGFGLALASLSASLTGCAGLDTGQVAAVLASPVESPSRTPSAAAGRLVAGFPKVVPVPPKARITASALAEQAEPELVGVSVTGTSRSTTKQLLAFFHDRLGAAGFTATDDSLLPPGTSGAAFGRGGRELLLVAVADRGTERSWSVGGTVARSEPAR
jgi:hypothetical protein